MFVSSPYRANYVLAELRALVSGFFPACYRSLEPPNVQLVDMMCLLVPHRRDLVLNSIVQFWRADDVLGGGEGARAEWPGWPIDLTGEVPGVEVQGLAHFLGHDVRSLLPCTGLAM